MSAYPVLTTSANVQAYLSGVSFSTDTAPTLAQVNNWIAQATSIIYGAIQDRYVLPITEGNDLKKLEALADSFVLTTVRQVLGRNPARTLSDGSLVPIELTHRDFYKTVEMYCNGTISLENSTENASFLSSSSFNKRNDIAFVSKKNEVMW
jgi:hypothetical protein